MANAFALSWESVNSDSLGTGYYFIRLPKKKKKIQPFKKGGGESHKRRELVFRSTRCQGEGREINCLLQFQQEIVGTLLAAALVSRELCDGYRDCKQAEGMEDGE